MAEALILEFTGDLHEDQYWAVDKTLGIDMVAGTGDFPDGLEFHAAGFAEDGRFVVYEVWGSREAQAHFMETRLGAALSENEVPGPPTVTWIPLLAHHSIGG
jgi:hypothetical protein